MVRTDFLLTSFPILDYFFFLLKDSDLPNFLCLSPISSLLSCSSLISHSNLAAYLLSIVPVELVDCLSQSSSFANVLNKQAADLLARICLCYYTSNKVSLILGASFSWGWDNWIAAAVDVVCPFYSLLLRSKLRPFLTCRHNLEQEVEVKAASASIWTNQPSSQSRVLRPNWIRRKKERGPCLSSGVLVIRFSDPQAPQALSQERMSCVLQYDPVYLCLLIEWMSSCHLLPIIREWSYCTRRLSC